MKDICIDARMVNSSGIGRYIQELLPEVVKVFNKVYLIGKREELDNLHLKRNYILINYSGDVYSLRSQLILPFLVKRCDVFWAPHFSSTFLPIRAKVRITTIHDCFHLANRNYFSFLEYTYAKFLYRQCVRVSDKIITVSNFSKQEIGKFLGNSVDVDIIYNGVDTDVFSSKNEEFSMKTISKYPSRYVLCVGNVKPHKNLKVIFEAFDKLNDKDLYLIIVGKRDGFIKSDLGLLNINVKSDNIIFTGFIEDKELVVLYQNAESFVFPSLYEGFGLPPLEALAANTRVIVSSYPPMKEICGKYVEYFDPHRVDQLTAILRNKQPVKNLFQVRLHLEKFSWKSSCEKHVELFRTLFAE